jgi:hypothetical protein
MKVCPFKEIEDYEYILKEQFNDDISKMIRHYRGAIDRASELNDRKSVELLSNALEVLKLIKSKRENEKGN